MSGVNQAATGKELWSSARNRLIKTFFSIIEWFKPAYTLTEQARMQENPGLLRLLGFMTWIGRGGVKTENV